MADSTSSPQFETRDDEIEYQALEGWSVLALVFGLLSPLALVAPVLWLLPMLGLLTAGRSLAILRREPGRPGRPMALAGLALATFFFVLPLSRQVTVPLLLRDQPTEVIDRFFEYLRDGSPEKALMLRQPAGLRHPLDEALWAHYRNDPESAQDLRSFVSEPAVRLLLALGKQADVKLVGPLVIGFEGKRAQINSLYAVNFHDEGRPKTYFIRVLAERAPSADPSISPWRIKGVSGGFDPWRT